MKKTLLILLSAVLILIFVIYEKNSSNEPISIEDCLETLEGTWTQTNSSHTYTFNKNGEYSEEDTEVGNFWITTMDNYENQSEFSEIELWPEILNAKLYPILVITFLPEGWDEQTYLLFIDYTGDKFWILQKGEDLEFTRN